MTRLQRRRAAQRRKNNRDVQAAFVVASILSLSLAALVIGLATGPDAREVFGAMEKTDPRPAAREFIPDRGLVVETPPWESPRGDLTMDHVNALLRDAGDDGGTTFLETLALMDLVFVIEDNRYNANFDRDAAMEDAWEIHDRIRDRLR